MKKLLLLIIVLVIFPACYPYEGESICGDPVQCESDDECVQKNGENFVCFNEREYYNQQNQIIKAQSLLKVETENCCAAPETYCIENICKSKNIDCGEGECQIGGHGYVQCICDENTNYTKYSNFDNYNIQQCLTDFTCEKSEDCLGISKKVSEAFIPVFICSPEGECVGTCLNDMDCIGDKEICLTNGYNKCLDLDTIECVENAYVNPYKEGECSYFCNETDSPCTSGFKCNTEQKCVPICTNNDDCLKDKFTGDTCNTELNYCE